MSHRVWPASPDSAPRPARFRLALAFSVLATPALASATEVQFEGYYRARVRMYDTLSLNRELQNSEGLAMYAQHRLWLRPRFLLNDEISVHAEIRGLDGVLWGDAPASIVDPVSGETLAVEFNDQLESPGFDDEDSPLVDITMWRAWAEFETRYGRFAFGRMPIHWGSGIWQNDGLSWNGDYGDSADRVRWDMRFDQVFVEAAIDVNAEGFVNEGDDTTSFNAAGGYRSEIVKAGVQAQFRRTPSREFNLFTIDAAAEAEIGMLDLRAEAVGQFGGGDLEGGVNDVQVAAGGGALAAQLETDVIDIGIEGGLATGDGDTSDQQIRTFSFDRDYNVGIILFEQTMPTVAAAASNETNQGRSQEVALSADALSNAIYFQPRVGRTIVEGLDAEASLLWARTAKVPLQNEDRTTYGMEVDATLRYTGIEHLDLAGTFGMFLPGSFYSEFSDDTYSGFDDTVYAGQIIGQVRF